MVTIECNFFWKPDKGQIIGQGVCIPVWMGPAIVRGNLNSLRLRISPYIMSPGQNIKSRGTEYKILVNHWLMLTALLFSTVRRCEDKLITDESSPTEPHVINEKSNNPGPFMLLCFKTTNNLSPWIMPIIFNPTNI